MYLACFPFDKVDIPLSLVPCLSLPSFGIPFGHYVIQLLHNFIYSSVFNVFLCHLECHQYLCFPPDFSVGLFWCWFGGGFFGFFSQIKRKNLPCLFSYYYFCFNLLAESGLKSLGMAIVQRACTGTNHIPRITWWDEKLLFY